MRVALILAPGWSVEHPTLGIATLAAFLKKCGHQVRVFDLNVSVYNQVKGKPTEAFWDPKDPKFFCNEDLFERILYPTIEPSLLHLIDKIAEYRPSVIGFSMFFSNLLSTQRIAQSLRNRLPGAIHVWGGPLVSEARIRNLSDQNVADFDFAVLGEGEETFSELLDKTSQNSVNGCRGTAYRNSLGELILEPSRPLISMGRVPSPDFSDIDFSMYSSQVIPVSMSRGCVAKCTFCEETQFWKKFRYRSATDVFEEMKELSERYGVNTFSFSDSLINGNLKVLEELVELINSSRLSFKWYGYARLDRRMTSEFLRQMARSGCFFLRYGFESGAQKVVDLMKKRTNVLIAEEIVRHTAQAGIDVTLQVIVGFPGETEVDFQQTYDFLERNISYITSIAPTEMMLLPNTPIVENTEKYGIEDTGSLYGHFWKTQDGENTHEVRRRRLGQVESLIEKHGLPEATF